MHGFLRRRTFPGAGTGHWWNPSDRWRRGSGGERIGCADRSYLLGGSYTSAELAADLRAIAPTIAQQRGAVGNSYSYDNYNEAALALDLMTCYDRIEAYVPSGHSSRLGRYLDLGMVNLNGLDTPRQTALNLVIPIDSNERFDVHGGNELIPQAGADGLLTNYTGGSGGAAYRPDGPYTDSLGSATTASYAAVLLPQLEQVWPGITPYCTGSATLSYPTGDPNLEGSYSAFGVGQFTSFCGYGAVPQGRIHFAGEHTSVQFIGYMEGGAESGLRAAQEVLSAA